MIGFRILEIPIAHYHIVASLENDVIPGIAIMVAYGKANFAYPTGGFSHSVGFEAAMKHGCVLKRGDYDMFATGILENAGSKLIPFVVASHSQFDNIDEIVHLEEICHSCLTNHVENRASKKQGRSFTETSSRTFHDKPALGRLQACIQSAELQGHLSVMFGAVCGGIGISLNDTLLMFMFSTLKTIISASVRLGHIGPMEGQKIQYDLQQIIPNIISRSRHINVEDVYTSFPIVDIIENIHDTMFAKLFYS